MGPPGCEQVAHVLDMHRVEIFVSVHMVEIVLVAHSIVDKLVRYAHDQFREWLQKF